MSDSAIASTPTWLTPPQVAELFGVAPETVISWIVAGELRAINVASRGKTRHRYRIDPADLPAFIAGRRVVKPPPVSQPRRKKSAIKEYY